MKLIHCNKCKDIVSLRTDWQRSCLCGESSGKYASDGIHAVVWGDCVVLGIANNSFDYAKTNHAMMPEGVPDGIIGMEGWRFEAFIIPENVATVRRIDAHN